MAVDKEFQHADDSGRRERDRAQARAEGYREGRLRGEKEAAERGHGRIYPAAWPGDPAEAAALMEATDLFVCEGCGAFVWGVVEGPLCSWCLTMAKFDAR